MVHAIKEFQKTKRRTYEPIIKMRQVIKKETKNVSRKLDE